MRLPRVFAPVTVVLCLLLLVAVGAPIAAAQERTVTLTGWVIDSTSGDPIGQAMLILDGAVLRVASESDGAFVIENVSEGPHTLLVQKHAFATKTFEFVITPDHPASIDVGVFGLAEALLQEVVLVGAVTDLRSGEGVGATPIMLNGRVIVLADTEGEFAVTMMMPGGVNVLEVRRVGYEPLTVELQIEPETTELTLDITLRTAAVPLRPVVVETAPAPVSRRLQGFYERKRYENGTFLTPEQIDRISAQRVTDILRTIPGLRVYGSGMNVRIDIPRCLRNLQPRILVDNLEYAHSNIDIGLQPQDIAAVEVYTAGARIPVQYNRPGSRTCGVILIWTKS
ncbi:MAG: carboxypeptidase regulatory-like domain-containing protein [Gemmatimonadetes bacterium]|nr:carboxypeptidase regulatory-like domain-containing protein [Gemmatimonadota bacterium]